MLQPQITDKVVPVDEHGRYMIPFDPERAKEYHQALLSIFNCSRPVWPDGQPQEKMPREGVASWVWGVKWMQHNAALGLGCGSQVSIRRRFNLDLGHYHASRRRARIDANKRMLWAFLFLFLAFGAFVALSWSFDKWPHWPLKLQAALGLF